MKHAIIFIFTFVLIQILMADNNIKELDQFDKTVTKYLNLYEKRKKQLDFFLPAKLKNDLNKQIYSVLGEPVPLNQKEIFIAKYIFGSSLDISKVMMFHKASFSKQISRTIRNNIFFNHSHKLKDPGYRNSEPFLKIFIHELTHVWQFQNKGSYYIVDSLVNQSLGYVLHNKRTEAYKYNLSIDQDFKNYNVEQQAKMIEEYFAMVFLDEKPGFCKNFEDFSKDDFIFTVETFIDLDINEKFMSAEQKDLEYILE